MAWPGALETASGLLGPVLARETGPLRHGAGLEGRTIMGFHELVVAVNHTTNSFCISTAIYVPIWKFSECIRLMVSATVTRLLRVFRSGSSLHLVDNSRKPQPQNRRAWFWHL